MIFHLMACDLEVWRNVLNGSFVPSLEIENIVVLNKKEDQLTNAKSKKVQYDMKV